MNLPFFPIRSHHLVDPSLVQIDYRCVWLFVFVCFELDFFFIHLLRPQGDCCLKTGFEERSGLGTVQQASDSGQRAAGSRQ